MRHGYWAALALAGLAACAEMAPPPGGPVDKTPPRLLGFEPDSLRTGASEFEPLRFAFSEKVDRRTFASALTVVPAVELSRPSFDGETVSVHPLEPWPEDQVIFWSLSAAMKDKHGVSMGHARSGAFTRRDSLPGGSISVLPVVAEGAWKKGASLQADLTLPLAEGERRAKLFRRAARSDPGAIELTLMDVPSGPFDLIVFLDGNGNGRRDEREPVAELDSLYLRGPERMLELGAITLVDLEGPVEIQLCAPAPADSAALLFFAESLEGEEAPRMVAADSAGCAVGLALPAGRYRAGAWVDLLADRKFGADSLGISEPFLAPVEFEVFPAQPDSLFLPSPYDRMNWTVIDTLRPPPVPPALHRDATP